MVEILAILYSDREAPVGQRISLRSVPRAGDFVHVKLTDEQLHSLGIVDDLGHQRAFEVKAVDHVDLDMNPRFEAELWCRYIKPTDHWTTTASRCRDFAGQLDLWLNRRFQPRTLNDKEASNE